MIFLLTMYNYSTRAWNNSPLPINSWQEVFYDRRKSKVFNPKKQEKSWLPRSPWSDRERYFKPCSTLHTIFAWFAIVALISMQQLTMKSWCVLYQSLFHIICIKIGFASCGKSCSVYSIRLSCINNNLSYE